MKLHFKKCPTEYDENRFVWNVISKKSTICNDFQIIGNDSVWSKRQNSDHEYSTHFKLEYNEEHNDIMLYCQPDYEEVELIGIRFCPWCSEKIEFELVK